jgi:hypothetical protein
MRWGFRWRAMKWLFCSGRVAFYYRNAGSLKTERWLFSSGLRTPRCHGMPPEEVAMDNEGRECVGRSRFLRL